MNITSKRAADPLERLRPQLIRLAAENSFLALEPVPEHSYHFQGWILESIKRANLRSHTRSLQAHTQLLAQLNDYYQQILALVGKRNEIKRAAVIGELNLRLEGQQLCNEICRLQRQAALEEVQVDTQIAEAQLGLVKAHSDMSKQHLQTQIEVDQLVNRLIENRQPKENKAQRNIRRRQEIEQEKEEELRAITAGHPYEQLPSAKQELVDLVENRYNGEILKLYQQK